MRRKKIISRSTLFDLTPNSHSYNHNKCIEDRQENLYRDHRSKRVKHLHCWKDLTLLVQLPHPSQARFNFPSMGGGGLKLKIDLCMNQTSVPNFNIFFLLITILLENALILQGEILSQWLLGVKGSNDKKTFRINSFAITVHSRQI